MKASTTICRAGIELPFAVLPESAALFQPGERPLHHPSLRQHHEGVQFAAFHHFHRGSQQALHRSGKGLPSVTPVHQHVLDLVEAGPVFVKHRQSPGPVGNIGGSHVYRMGQSLRVHRDMTLDSRHLLARVIALVPGGVRVLHALGVHDAEAGLLFRPLLCRAAPTDFFRTCSRMES